jgi:hypothetical protein
MTPNDIESDIPREGQSPLAGTASSLDTGSSVTGGSRSGRSTASSVDDGSSAARSALAGRSTASSLDSGASVAGSSAPSRSTASSLEDGSSIAGSSPAGRSTASPLDRGSSVAGNAPAGRPTASAERPFADDGATSASATGERGSPRNAEHRERNENPPSVGDPLLGTPLEEDGSYDEEFRRDYDSRYAQSGTPYDEYRRAYTHGATLGKDERYRGSDWQKVEPGAREHWESHYPESAWDRFKAAVRHGWERVTDRRS